jgi:phosphopantothenoylcysteine decarboxylase/phosphopantothenate--cysteine ligase
MDGDMWTHPATVANVARLEAFGYSIVAPEAGPLASGQAGVGRLADLSTIVDAVVAAIGSRPVRQPDPAARPPLREARPREADLLGRHIVVTAGGTREPIDPVRYIGNRSSGKMGVAVATAALERGARVTLLAAAVEVPLPSDATTVRIETTGELRGALLRTLFGGGGDTGDGSRAGGNESPADALVMAAAVSDFAPTHPSDGKLRRADGLSLELSATPDLLAEVGRIVRGLDATGERTRELVEPAPVLVGFAAETGSLDRAADKLASKGVDLLVANDVSETGSGFGTETNRVSILDAAGAREDLPLLTKREVADRILDRVAAALDARDAAVQTAGTHGRA